MTLEQAKPFIPPTETNEDTNRTSLPDPIETGENVSNDISNIRALETMENILDTNERISPSELKSIEEFNTMSANELLSKFGQEKFIMLQQIINEVAQKYQAREKKSTYVENMLGHIQGKINTINFSIDNNHQTPESNDGKDGLTKLLDSIEPNLERSTIDSEWVQANLSPEQIEEIFNIFNIDSNKTYLPRNSFIAELLQIEDMSQVESITRKYETSLENNSNVEGNTENTSEKPLIPTNPIDSVPIKVEISPEKLRNFRSTLRSFREQLPHEISESSQGNKFMLKIKKTHFFEKHSSDIDYNSLKPEDFYGGNEGMENVQDINLDLNNVESITQAGDTITIKEDGFTSTYTIKQNFNEVSTMPINDIPGNVEKTTDTEKLKEQATQNFNEAKDIIEQQLNTMDPSGVYTLKATKNTEYVFKGRNDSKIDISNPYTIEALKNGEPTGAKIEMFSFQEINLTKVKSAETLVAEFQKIVQLATPIHVPEQPEVNETVSETQEVLNDTPTISISKENISDGEINSINIDGKIYSVTTSAIYRSIGSPVTLNIEGYGFLDGESLTLLRKTDKKEFDASSQLPEIIQRLISKPLSVKKSELDNL